MLEGTYTPIGAPKQSLNGTGTVIKRGYMNWVPCIDDGVKNFGVEYWEKGLKRARLEMQKEIVLGPDTKLKQLGVDSVMVTETIKGHNAGQKTLSFLKKGCYLNTYDFKDKAGMRKAISILQNITKEGKNFSIDQLAFILKKFR